MPHLPGGSLHHHVIGGAGRQRGTRGRRELVGPGGQRGRVGEGGDLGGGARQSRRQLDAHPGRRGGAEPDLDVRQRVAGGIRAGGERAGNVTARQVRTRGQGLADVRPQRRRPQQAVHPDAQRRVVEQQVVADLIGEPVVGDGPAGLAARVLVGGHLGVQVAAPAPDEDGVGLVRRQHGAGGRGERVDTRSEARRARQGGHLVGPVLHNHRHIRRPVREVHLHGAQQVAARI